VYAANGKFLTRVTFKDGINTSTKTVNTTGVGNSQIKTFDETLQEVTVTSLIKSTTYYFIYIVPSISNQELVPVDPGLGGSSGGGSSTSIPTKVDTIAKSIINHCIDSVFQKITNDSLKSKLAKMIGDFCTNKTIKVTFNEVTTLPDSIFGVTYGTDGENYNIDLNLNILPHCSQELIALTLFHESIHAYLKNHISEYDFENNPSHLVMLEKYISDLVNALTEIFPNLSKKDAYCLSILGLNSSSTDSEEIKTKFMVLRNLRIGLIKSKYPELDTEDKIMAISDSYDNTGTNGKRSSDCK
jgi:hypothetical protein